MLTAVVAAVPVALGLVVAALPIVLVPVALATRRPPGVARAFLAGWLVGVCAVGAAVIAFADVLVLPRGGGPWLDRFKIVLGLLLVFLALRKWRARPRPGETPEAPKWMDRVGALSAARVFGVAFALVAVNPKNLVLVVAGATVIADATPVPAQQAVALVVFALVSSVGVAAPTVVVAVLGERAPDVLATADRWMTRHGTTVVAAVLAVLGVLLVIGGVTAT